MWNARFWAHIHTHKQPYISALPWILKSCRCVYCASVELNWWQLHFSYNGLMLICNLASMLLDCLERKRRSVIVICCFDGTDDCVQSGFTCIRKWHWMFIISLTLVPTLHWIAPSTNVYEMIRSDDESVHNSFRCLTGYVQQ